MTAALNFINEEKLIKSSVSECFIEKNVKAKEKTLKEQKKRNTQVVTEIIYGKISALVSLQLKRYKYSSLTILNAGDSPVHVHKWKRIDGRFIRNENPLQLNPKVFQNFLLYYNEFIEVKKIW